jgi:hypothetical protein
LRLFKPFYSQESKQKVSDSLSNDKNNKYYSTSYGNYSSVERCFTGKHKKKLKKRKRKKADKLLKKGIKAKRGGR